MTNVLAAITSTDIKMAEKNGVQKEDDVIKLFVGQIPKHYEREDIEEIMSEFGEIFEISVIRDKITNEHKGCAFITYVCRTAATNAQLELHEKRTLQGMSHAMQVCFMLLYITLYGHIPY